MHKHHRIERNQAKPIILPVRKNKILATNIFTAALKHLPQVVLAGLIFENTKQCILCLFTLAQILILF